MPGLTIKPSLEEVRELRTRGNLIPIYAEFSSDLDTPVSLYMRLAGEDPGFLLESVTGGERIARYSFLGVRMYEALVLRDGALFRHTLTDGTLNIAPWPAPPGFAGRDVLDQLREEMSRYHFVTSPDLPRFCGGYLGYTGYDVVRQFEDLLNTARKVLPVPDAVYVLVDALIAFDHVRQRLIFIANVFAPEGANLETAYEQAVARIKTMHARVHHPLPRLLPDASAECAPAIANRELDAYCEIVRKAQEHVRAGDTFQIQLSRRLKRRTTAHPFSIYRELRRINPSPWMVYLNLGKLVDTPQPLRLIIASPELHARYEDGIATVRPIAGTRRRGRSDAEDVAMANELIHDPKERAEHVMLIDLGRNDIGRIAKFGSVSVPDLMVIERYSHVMHIVSSVTGEVREGMDMFDVLRATFPAGTLTGAPKVRTMQLIEQFEGERRHIYGGCAGYFSFSGHMDTCIVIRSIIMLGDTCWLQAAGGVVYDSVPELEFKESNNKLRACLLAIEQAEMT